MTDVAPEPPAAGSGALPPDDLRALVALLAVPGVGPARAQALVAAFGGPGAVLAARPARLAEVEGVGPETARRIAAFDAWGEVDAALRRAARAGADALTLWDAGYPAHLREIYDPPPLLWVRGAFVPADDRALAVVGTRRVSDYGRRATRAFAAGLAEAGWTVVSGLAYGVDAVAHEAALDAGGRSVAVLGSGIDRVYPARHARLAERCAHAGALVSEFAPGAAPDAPNFPRRNRVVAGLCRGVLVAEAFEDGGALLTAKLALDQDREVFAVPAPFDHAPGAGTNRLIQRGEAKLVLTVADVLDELGSPGAPAAPPPPDLTGLTDAERALLGHLGADPLPLDALCARAGLDPAAALVLLLGLEFRGLVRQTAGKHFTRA